MTAQEVFDTVALHLLTQNAKSMLPPDEDFETCAYRSPDGRKCAVGCLIPDDKYDDRVERLNIEEVADLLGGDTGELLLDHEDLLDALRQVHDDYDPERWRDELRVVATEQSLSLAVLEQP